MKGKQVKKYEEVITLAKVLAHAHQPYLSEQNIVTIVHRTPSFYSNWFGVAQTYPTFFIVKQEKLNMFSKKMTWVMGLLDRVSQLTYQKKMIPPLQRHELTALMHNIRQELKTMETLIQEMTVQRTISDISTKSKLWMDEISIGNLAQTMMEIEEYLNTNKTLPSSHLVDFLLLKTRYTNLLQKEKKVENLINHPKYLELENDLEQRKARLNMALFTLLENLSLKF